MRRSLRITLAVVLFLAAALILLIALSGTTTTYYLPPTDPDQFADERTVLFRPAVIASIVAAASVLATVAWLVLVARRARRLGAWLGAVVLVVVDLVVLVVALGVDRPTF